MILPAQQPIVLTTRPLATTGFRSGALLVAKSNYGPDFYAIQTENGICSLIDGGRFPEGIADFKPLPAGTEITLRVGV